MSATELTYAKPSSLTAGRRETLERQHPGIFKRHPRAYSKWTADEDKHLERLVDQGFTVEEIAGYHGREKRAIRSRLDRSGLAAVESPQTGND